MAYDSLKAEIRQYIKTNGQNEITGQILQDVLIDMVNNYPSLDGYLHPTINNLGTGDIIQFNGSAWVNTPLSSALSGYATQSWVESLLNGYATQSWVNSNFLALDGGGTIYNDDYWLGIFGNELLFKYNGTTYGSISLDYGPDGPEFDISSNATLGGATIATQTWVGQNYLPNNTAVINGVTGDDFGHLTLTGNNFTTTILDLTHQHRWEDLVDRPAIDMWNDTMIAVGGIVSSGKIGAGMSSAPLYMLEVNGQTMLYYNVGIGTSPASGYSLDIDGSARASSFVNNSDIRKKDVLEYDVAPGFEEVVNAPTIRFTWKQPGRMNNRGECVGSIAQYWRNAIPEAVVEDADGYLSMQYDVIALLAAVSVAKKVADNEQRIAALEQENALLRMELKDLKAS